MKGKSVSVVVPAYNAEDTISMCIESLLAQDFPKDDFEIIIVDNNSTDRTAEIIKNYPVRYVAEKRKGASAARNAGIDAARGRLIALIDSDCIAGGRWLTEGVKPFKKEETGCVSGRVVSYEPSNMWERIISERDEYAIPPDYWGWQPYAITANAFFRKEVFERVGKFDTIFRQPSAEDKDLCWRMLKKTNFVIEQRPSAIVFHKHRSNLKSYFRQHLHYSMNDQILKKKYPEVFKRREMLLMGQKTKGTLIGIIRDEMKKLAGAVKQALCIPKVFWMTAGSPYKRHTRTLHLSNLSRSIDKIMFIGYVKQVLFIPVIFWMTRKDAEKEYKRKVYLLDLARRTASFSGTFLGKLKVLMS